ncbi:glutathione S-transferase C-terminal domain-containing protein, partial [Aliiroseovarius sp. 2305UL8-7]|uniref:glutathione S-transferase C-terminal domain-containing protein n=1 Tax=Aliiroseovarius conchicola TaxID=3121637 RepID=UPI0035293EBB
GGVFRCSRLLRHLDLLIDKMNQKSSSIQILKSVQRVLTSDTYTGRATIPMLWDTKTGAVVSNESVQILRGLDVVRGKEADQDWTLRPADLVSEIDTLAPEIQIGLSNAVYRAGKAQRQEIYDAAVHEVFGTLDHLEDRLSRTRYLHGSVLTETDLRLWPTLARFDAVYHGHFKCSRRRLTDYPNLWGYARDIHGWCGVAATLNEPAIRAAYYGEDREINPHGVVATAPETDWEAQHRRDAFGPAMVTLRDGTHVEVDPAVLSLSQAKIA